MALKATIETREELKGKSLSFTEITKLVGKKWQNLTASEKEPYEQQSFDAKEKCRIELAEYEQTESYKAYSEYLLDFNAKQLHIQESSQESPNGTSKMPKLENIPSASSTSRAKRSTTLTGYCDTIRDACTRPSYLQPLRGVREIFETDFVQHWHSQGPEFGFKEAQPGQQIEEVEEEVEEEEVESNLSDSELELEECVARRTRSSRVE
ncbi:hypothetical protein V502_01551 [Pseudogymnoascus sp. VKM F-4520 (FW-2644)]|nr:hypothetical protein V502_01551 [Pseudogymnoascus sp. VKM F-4520 (FW-2644)]